MTLTLERAEYAQLIAAVGCDTNSGAQERTRAIKRFVMGAVRNLPLEAASAGASPNLVTSRNTGPERLDGAMEEREDLKEDALRAIQETVQDLIEDLHLFAPEFPGKSEIVYRARRAISRFECDSDRSGLYDEMKAIWVSLPA